MNKENVVYEELESFELESLFLSECRMVITRAWEWGREIKGNCSQSS